MGKGSVKRKAEESGVDAEVGFHERFRSLAEEWPEEMSRLFSPKVPEDQRSSLLDLIGEQGEELKGEFAWAIPDERAIRILKHFSPIVEVGAGKGYWASLLKKAGGDILAFDAVAESGGGSNREKGAHPSSKAGEPAPSWTEVLPGGPEVLGLPSCKGRALLLCYPDEYELSETSLGEACLDEFQGDIVIHVGEVFGDTISVSQAPWGRTSGPDFLCRLSSEFHCILKAALPSWPISRDTISVWKRTVVTAVQYGGKEEEEEEEEEEKKSTGKGKQEKHKKHKAQEEEEEDIGDSEGDEDDEDDDEGEEAGEGVWAHIPAEERLSQDVAAPCVAHLLLP